MEIKVKEVTKEEKSIQQIEQELLAKHEEKYENATSANKTESVQTPVSEETPVAEENIVEEKQTPSSELNDEDVLTYIKKRYDKDISSVDELFAQTKDNDDLPEDVSAYLKYKKETRLRIEDFYKLQKGFNAMEYS